MNDDRFEFEKLSRPSVWLNFYKGAGGGFRSNGKMKLPPGHALANKFPEKVATKQEMEERAAKMGGGAGGGESKMPNVINGDTFEEVDKILSKQIIPPDFFTETEITRGTGMSRGSGKRAGKQVMGGMSSTLPFKERKTVMNKDKLMNPEQWKEYKEFSVLSGSNFDVLEQAYLQARAYGYNHDQSLNYAVIKMPLN